MVKKWALGAVVLVMFVAPMLACGFPLPAGTATLAPTKAVCAADESTDSCNLRRDAYQLMAELNSAVVTDVTADLYIDDGVEVLTSNINGQYDYVVSATSDYLGANIRAELDDATVAGSGDIDDISDTTFLLIDDVGYTYSAQDEAWLQEALDPTALLGLSFMMGISGNDAANLDLFAAPDVFTVTQGEPVMHEGQEMIVQTLNLDLQALLSNQEALYALFDDASQMELEGIGFDISEMGDPQEIVPVAGMLLPFLEGTEVSSTLWIGAEDGYIHYVEQNYALEMDLSAMDSNTPPMAMRYNLTGTITDHNAPLTMSVPDDVIESDDPFTLGDGLFGN